MVIEGAESSPLLTFGAGGECAMSIDDSGKWWTATEPSDIPIYLAENTRFECAYPATEFRQVRCECGSERFLLIRARTVTQRTCAVCGQVGYISRGKVALAAWHEAIDEEKPEPFCCVGCEGDEANVCVGFAGYPEAPHLPAGSVKWFYVGIRCAGCGVLSVFNDGKVGRHPAEEVYPEVTGEADLLASKSNRQK
jgi:hypothetical protein